MLLTVDDLQVRFRSGRQVLRAVDSVSFGLERGETLGLVGESGCGKSTTGRALLRLVPVSSGEIVFDGIPVHRSSGSVMRGLRRRMQMVFQDPFASLSPRMRVGQIVGEPLEIHRWGSGAGERRERVASLLDDVGLGAGVIDRYPHEFSGGQRQRIGIARALALEPELVVLDEPVSALDISVRAQVVNLLMRLQRERGLSYVFIGHDLSLIRHVADRVAVMYLGRIVESGPAQALYDNPRHPYTRSLFASAPVPDPSRRNPAPPLDGDPPSPFDIPSGCRFRTRCPYATSECAQVDPAPYPVAAGHYSACVRFAELPVWNSAAAT